MRDAPSAPAPRLLIVARDPEDVAGCTGALDPREVPYTLLEDPVDARRAILDGTADVVVADLALCGGSADLIGAVRARRPPAPLVLLASRGQRRAAARALELGAFAIVPKPILPEEVAAQVGRARASLRQADALGRCLIARRRAEHALLQAAAEPTERLIADGLRAALEARDTETSAHVERIGRSAERLGEALGWSGPDVEDLHVTAGLHDIGKIGVPDAILRKPGRLSPEEFAIAARHSTIGARILGGRPRSRLLSAAGTIALHHHERWDGSGYPGRLAGEAIPRAARIVAVVDVYDALVHARPYRDALPERVALEYMRFQRARQFDPRVYDAFVEALPDLKAIRDSVEATRAA